MRHLAAIVSVLVGAGIGAGHAAARPAVDQLLFTRADGLSGSGAIVARWVDDARFHGLELAPDPIVAAWVSAHGGPYDRQLAVEASLSAALERLVAELPPAPRTDPVLDDPETQFYLSPDVTWRALPRREAAPELLAKARVAALDGTLDAFLRALEPQHEQYRRLVEAGRRYAGYCAAGGWSAIARPKIPKKKAWVPPPELARVFQERLAKEGLYPPPGQAPSGVWDADTDAALGVFRATRQLVAKGLDEDDLIAALAVPCETRLATIVLNVKRWRVSARTASEATYVEVNLAAQELRYVRDHALVMQQRTIVGATKWYFDRDLKRRLNLHATPILSDHISRVVVNPTWAVPPRIAKNEIDAEVAKDPTYLEKHNMQLVTSARGRTYIQSPGAGNALGVIKILFPNDESVYLHDTPKKAAFKLAVRALSHGCVRVQNAVDFGVALLAADAAGAGEPFDEEAVRKRAGRGGTYIYDLKAQVPVFLEYYTASVDDGGRVRFHPDIYAYDADTLTAR